MELDDLKNAWTNSVNTIKHRNQSIYEIIQSKSTGPVAKLKRRFKKGMILMPAITAMGIVQLSNQQGFFLHFLSWFFLGFSILMIIYFYLNYRLMSRIQTLEGNVKDNLNMQVKLLQTGLTWRLLITRSMAVIFILITELLTYLKIVPEFESWHKQNVFLRVTVYAACIIFFYLLTKFATDFRYRKHIVHLKELIDQMQ